MKTILFTAIMAITIFFTACGDNNSNTNDAVTNNKDSVTSSVEVNSESTSSITTKEIVSDYLDLKNALANDNGKDAADAAHDIQTSLEKMNTGSFTPDQKKTYENVKGDLKEHAEHIAANGSNISHQREHFDMMS